MLTAATGMDAIAHCMETFMASAFNPPADGIGLDGLTRGWAHIERAMLNGNDAEARRQLMSASMQGAMAFQKGLGCVHSLSHSLGGINPRLHHGTLNAMFLPAVVRFNAEAESVQREDRLNRMAHAMGLSSGSDIPDAIRDMNARLNLPSGLPPWAWSARSLMQSSTVHSRTTATPPIHDWHPRRTMSRCSAPRSDRLHTGSSLNDRALLERFAHIIHQLPRHAAEHLELIVGHVARLVIKYGKAAQHIAFFVHQRHTRVKAQLKAMHHRVACKSGVSRQVSDHNGLFFIHDIRAHRAITRKPC
jgi:hypothetical protein